MVVFSQELRTEGNAALDFVDIGSAADGYAFALFTGEILINLQELLHEGAVCADLMRFSSAALFNLEVCPLQSGDEL